jgi:heme-degrading monooxygenase HmoA
VAPAIRRATGIDERTMIARIWTGATPTRDAAAYQEYMGRVAMPGYAEVAGNRMVLMLRRDRDDDRTEFTMITLWADLEAVRLFTGLRVETAVFYPEDDRFLVERDRLAGHHLVYGLHRSLLGWSRRAEGPTYYTRLSTVV